MYIHTHIRISVNGCGETSNPHDVAGLLSGPGVPYCVPRIGDMDTIDTMRLRVYCGGVG
jgi:hypothetical protein